MKSLKKFYTIWFLVFLLLIIPIIYYFWYIKRKITKNVIFKLTNPKFEGRKSGSKGMNLCRTYLCSLFKKLSLKQVSWAKNYKQYFTNNSTKYMNIVGLLPSNNNEKSNTIIMMAHYDHLGIKNGELYPGANDNASSIYVLLSLVEELNKKRNRKHSYIFIFTDGEEADLFGAKYLMKTGVLKNTKLIINFDMVGGCKQNKIAIVPIIPNKSNKLKENINSLTKDIQTNKVPIKLDILNKKPVDRTDLSVFTKEGYPGIDIGYCLNKHYHKPTDTEEKLNYDTMNYLIKYLVILTEKYIS